MSSDIQQYYYDIRNCENAMECSCTKDPTEILIIIIISVL